MPEIRSNVFGTVGKPSQRAAEPAPAMSMPDLRSLIELGCIRDSVTVGETVFTMRSLSATERVQLMKFVSTEPTDEVTFGFNVRLLSMAIETVNGVPFEEFHPDSEMDPLSRREQVLSQMQMPVLAQLLDLYNKITARCDSQFEREQLKNSQRSPGTGSDGGSVRL
jgi:hypothetical protein